MALADERFDSVLLAIAQQSQGIEPLLDVVFSFLRRKTDFFTGASPDVINDMVQRVVMKHAQLADRTRTERERARADDDKRTEKARKAAAAKAKREEERQKQERAAAKASKAAEVAAAAPAPAANEDGVVELGEDGAFDAACTNQPATPPPPPAPAAAEPMEEDPGAAATDPEQPEPEEPEEEEDKEPPPPGNGMILDNYSWTQQLAELQVNVPVPDGTKSRQITVEIKNKRLKVGLKGQPPVLDGELHKRVIVDDCLWTLENNKEVVISLQKENRMEWWKCVVVGEPEINTQKVVPENSKLGDLDGETRQTVEKMMFDQRQKAAGLPTSDEQKKQEMLNNFMKQHPEMDFSKAKFN